MGAGPGGGGDGGVWTLMVRYFFCVCVFPEGLCLTEPEVVRVLDGMFVWRTVVLVLLAVAALVGGLFNLLDFGLHTVQPASIKKLRSK